MTHIDATTAKAYADGHDPIDWAVDLAQSHLLMFAAAAAGQWPGQSSDPAHWARRVVGQLLGAGWTPPYRQAPNSPSDVPSGGPR